MEVYDSYELAAHLVGLDVDEVDESEIDDALHSRWGVDGVTLAEIVGKLLPLIDIAEGGLSGKVYQGFSIPVDGAKPGVRQWLARVERETSSD